MREVNGFKVDKWNQYNLSETSKYSTCPLCSADRKKSPKEKCLTLHWDTGIGQCHHCGERVQLHTYKKKKDEVQYKRPEKWNRTDLPDHVVKYWEGRKISQFTLRMMKIGFAKEWMPQTKGEIDTIQFPYFRDSELINVKYRGKFKSADGTPKRAFKLVKDAQKIPYNIDAIKTQKECIIVEGEPDVLSMIECGISNVVSNPNGSVEKGMPDLTWLDEHIEYFDNKDTIYLGLDNDKAGQNVQKELIRRLGAHRVKILDYGDYKDANDLLVAESKEALKTTVLEAKELPLDNVTSYKDSEAELISFYQNGAPKGFTTRIEGLDSVFSTYTGQYIVITGIPSHGKSEVVDQMCLGYALNYGWHIGYASPENKPNYLHTNKLMTKLLGRKPKYEDVGTSQYMACSEFYEKHISHLDYEAGYDLKSVLDKGAELVKRKGLKCLVIDPFNKVRLKESLGKGVNEYTTDYLEAIDSFARKYDVLVILVAHPNKLKPVDGVMPEPTMYDIKGGGEFYDMAYHGLLVYRDFENTRTKIKILKCKFQHLGENNAHVFLKYNPHSTRYMTMDNGKGVSDSKNWVTDELDKQNSDNEYDSVVGEFSGNEDVFAGSTIETEEKLPF